MAAFFGITAIILMVVLAIFYTYDAFKFVYGGDNDDRVS